MTSQVSVSEQGDALSQHLWRSRVVVIFASERDDGRIAEQKRIVSRMGRGVVEFVGGTPDARAVRRKLGAPASGFEVVLVGKDGGAKLRSPQPLTADELAATIDAMPMRRREMEKR